MRHNGVLPNAHFRKHWQGFVRTWFNQAARKRRRQLSRQAKSADLNPRPLENLRPVVRGQTQRYNLKSRFGRGFSLQELKEAGLNAKFARTIGIAVDSKRRNKSQESLELNKKRLQAFLAKLVLFPRNANKPKKGVVNDSNAETIQKAQLVQTGGNPAIQVIKREKAITISKELRKLSVYNKLRKSWAQAKYIGKKKEKKAE